MPDFIRFEDLKPGQFFVVEGTLMRIPFHKTLEGPIVRLPDFTDVTFMFQHGRQQVRPIDDRTMNNLCKLRAYR
jgi:hypothetical protein